MMLKTSALQRLLLRVRYEWLYWRGKPRWDTGIVPPELRDLIEVEQFPPGRALDIGCGTGTNAIHLAQHGFDVVGIDLVPRAIHQAREKARQAQVRVDFRAADVLTPMSLGKPFDFILDIGCLHNFDVLERKRYLDNLLRWTHQGSLFMVYAFFPRAMGGRRFGIAPDEMNGLFEAVFRLVSSTVEKNKPTQDSAWYRWERK